MTWPALERATEALPGEIRRAVGVHFGWWDAHDERLDAACGKLVRPALVLVCCRASGGTDRQGLPAAVTVELVHNASLLHDVIDHDLSRHGRPTAVGAVGSAARAMPCSSSPSMSSRKPVARWPSTG